jgi:hypothetical protein
VFADRVSARGANPAMIMVSAIHMPQLAVDLTFLNSIGARKETKGVVAVTKNVLEDTLRLDEAKVE